MRAPSDHLVRLAGICASDEGSSAAATIAE